MNKMMLKRENVNRRGKIARSNPTTDKNKSSMQVTEPDPVKL